MLAAAHSPTARPIVAISSRAAAPAQRAPVEPGSCEKMTTLVGARSPRKLSGTASPHRGAAGRQLTQGKESNGHRTECPPGEKYSAFALYPENARRGSTLDPAALKIANRACRRVAGTNQQVPNMGTRKKIPCDVWCSVAPRMAGKGKTVGKGRHGQPSPSRECLSVVMSSAAAYVSRVTETRWLSQPPIHSQVPAAVSLV